MIKTCVVLFVILFNVYILVRVFIEMKQTDCMFEQLCNGYIRPKKGCSKAGRHFRCNGCPSNDQTPDE